MAPKRKKKTLTPEEKRAKKAEKAERQKELQVKTNHDTLYREIRYGDECLRQHAKQWRALLLSIAEPRMRAELEYAMHYFERTVDNKDFEISLLMDELKTADEQYKRSVRSHIDDIDRIIVLCYDQIAELWRESSSIISNLYRAATTERGDVMRIDADHETYLKTMLFCLSENSREVGKLMRGDYLSKLEVETSRLNDFAARMRDDLMFDIDDLWTFAQDFIRKYKAEFAQRQEKFEVLEQSDVEMQAATKHIWEQCLRAWETIKILKGQHVSISAKQSRRIRELTEKKNYYEGIAKQLKQQLRDERVIDNENLTELILTCNEVEAGMVALAKRGEQLLSLGAICRKYETLEEKTMRFPDYKAFVPKMKNKEVEMMVALSEGNTARNKMMLRRNADAAALKVGVPIEAQGKADKEEEQEVVAEEDEVEAHFPEMEIFWLRFGALQTSRVKLLEECAMMRAENEHLRRKFFMYCECLNCDPQVHFLYDNPNFLG